MRRTIEIKFRVEKTLDAGWVDGWMEGKPGKPWTVDGWMDGWKEGKARLRIAYSNKKKTH